MPLHFDLLKDWSSKWIFISALFFIIAVFFISGSKTESAKNEVDQLNKGGKTGKKKDENLNSSQSNENKESTNTDNQTAEEKKSTDPLPAPLTKEEEEELAQQRKDDRKRKDQDFLNQLAKAVSRSAIQPLGRDRVFRRYWTFKSLRGLFVEDDDPDQHLLLEPELKVKEIQKKLFRWDLQSKLASWKPLTSILHNLGDLDMQGRLSIWILISANNMYLMFVKLYGRLPFTPFIRVEIFGVNIQCSSLSKRKMKKSENVLVSIAKFKKKRKKMH